MTKKVQKILLIIFLTALIVALMATSFLYASTYGRYSGGALSDDSTYDDSIEFVGAEQFVVYTPEELIEAIENGVARVHILDGRVEHCLLLEFFTEKGIGTAILKEPIFGKDDIYERIYG